MKIVIFLFCRRFRVVRCVLMRLGCCMLDDVDPRRRLYTDPPTTSFTQCTYINRNRMTKLDTFNDTAPSSTDESKDLCDLVLSATPSQIPLTSQTTIRWRNIFLTLKTSVWWYHNKLISTDVRSAFLYREEIM